MKLTCNQMVLLLQLYRGLKEQDKQIGTFNADLRYLQSQGLVEADADNDGLTTKGHDRVQRALADEARIPTNWPIPEPYRTKLKELRRSFLAASAKERARLILDTLAESDSYQMQRYMHEAMYSEDFMAVIEETKK